MNTTAKIITPKTQKEVDDYYNLRWSVLRKPWNKEKGSEKDESDSDALHFSAVINGEIVGVIRLHLNHPKQAQLRYMAVSNAYQKKGIGTLLIHHVEMKAKTMGATEMILQAREVALDFYKKQNYSIVEKSYLLFDSIQHYLMKKEL